MSGVWGKISGVSDDALPKTKRNRVPIEHSYLKQLQHGCCML